jgi:putative ABC transport system permease protein
VPVVGIGTMAARFDASVSPRRFATLLAAGFGGLAVLIACLGVWGLARHSLTEDRQELGVRAALGADPARLLSTLLGRTAGLAALGVAVGLAASVVIGRLLAHRLFDTGPTDPAVLGAATEPILPTSSGPTSATLTRGSPRPAPGILR